MPRNPSTTDVLRFALQNARWLLNPNEGSEREVDDAQMIEVARELAGNLEDMDKAIRGKRRLPASWARALAPDRECHCPGWLHQHHNPAGPADHVERCDTCRIFRDDVAAAAAHKRDCGCGLTVAR